MSPPADQRHWLTELRGGRLVREVAAAAGTSTGAISNIEGGRSDVRISTIPRLAAAYAVDRGWLAEQFMREADELPAQTTAPQDLQKPEEAR